MNKQERSKNAANIIGKHEVVRDEIICAIMNEVEAIHKNGYVNLISPQGYLSNRENSTITKVYTDSNMVNDLNQMVEATEISTSDLSSILLNILSLNEQDNEVL